MLTPAGFATVEVAPFGAGVSMAPEFTRAAYWYVIVMTSPVPTRLAPWMT